MLKDACQLSGYPIAVMAALSDPNKCSQIVEADTVGIHLE